MLRQGRARPEAGGGPLSLATAARRSHVRVVGVRGRPRLIQRLAALGVVPGAQLTVLRSHGPALVAMGDARVAIGKHAAECVEVEVTE